MQTSAHSRRTRNDAPIICAGEALIDLISNPTENWAEIQHFTPRIGGAPANTAVAIRRLGGQSAFFGCIANDSPGAWIRSRLEQEGVDLTRIVDTPTDAQTRLAAVTGAVDRRDFVFYGSPPADSLMAPEDVDAAHLGSATAIMLGSLLLLTEPSRSAMFRLLELADAHTIPIAFDPNPRPKSWTDPQRARALLLPFIRKARILKLGADEPAILGMTVDQIRNEQPHGALFVLTDGANGCCYWYGDDRAVAVPPFTVAAIDSTGAGDAFTAALTLRFVQNDGDISAADIQFASAVGALTTTRQGAMDALPTTNQVDQLLQRG